MFYLKLWNFPSPSPFFRYFKVSLMEKTCECGRWALQKYACKHAIALLHHLRNSHASTLQLEDLCLDQSCLATTGFFCISELYSLTICYRTCNVWNPLSIIFHSPCSWRIGDDWIEVPNYLWEATWQAPWWEEVCWIISIQPAMFQVSSSRCKFCISSSYSPNNNL